MQIGNKIKKLREIKGLTREYMAAELKMSISSYSRMERDEVSITLGKLQQVSEVLELNYLDILSFDEKQIFNFINNLNYTNAQRYIQNQKHIHSPRLIEELNKRIEELEKIIKEKIKL